MGLVGSGTARTSVSRTTIEALTCHALVGHEDLSMLGTSLKIMEGIYT